METNVLVNGEWVSRVVDVQAVLEHHDQRDMRLGMASEVESAPDVGILSQTIVRSPIINHILPVRMRGLEHNDVAFIGVCIFFLFLIPHRCAKHKAKTCVNHATPRLSSLVGAMGLLELHHTSR
jgi:hypothetical protein